MSLRALGAPRRARVEAGPDGVPRAVEVTGRRRAVTAVRDDWRVQDLWWTDRPVDRHYHELVVEPGRVVLAYRDDLDGSWHVYSAWIHRQIVDDGRAGADPDGIRGAPAG